MKFQVYLDQQQKTMTFRSFPTESITVDSLDIRVITFEANQWLSKKLAKLKQNNDSIPNDKDYPDLMDEHYSTTFWCSIG